MLFIDFFVEGTNIYTLREQIIEENCSLGNKYSLTPDIPYSHI